MYNSFGIQGRELLNTSMFGGNTGQQGIFDPDNPDEKAEAIRQLQSLYDTYGDKLTYNYTGDTGLASNDIEGYARWQNAITEADNISRTLSGQQPRNMRFGGTINQAPVRGLQKAAPKQQQILGKTGMPYSSILNRAIPMPEPHDTFKKRYGR